MKRIELPRPIEDYFAFAELPPGERGRRFTITFTYFEGERLDRLQWWWQVSATQEQLGGDEVVAKLRTEAVTRFRRHIERWLENTGQRLHGAEPFPLIARMPVAAASEPELPLVLLPEPQVANG